MCHRTHVVSACRAFLHLCVLIRQLHAGFAYDQTRAQLYALLQSATIQDNSAADMMLRWTSSSCGISATRLHA
ncbi:hypothetical protein FIBSPDRAFT_879485, partial [Athelia psychrophila]